MNPHNVLSEEAGLLASIAEARTEHAAAHRRLAQAADELDIAKAKLASAEELLDKEINLRRADGARHA